MKAMRISVNGREVARGAIDRTIFATAGLGETFDTGRDTGAPVVAYKGSDLLTADIRRIDVQMR